jgi:hypothetical protein
MICGACGKSITECEMCGGMLCEANCPDREEDGCTCDEGMLTEEEMGEELPTDDEE